MMCAVRRSLRLFLDANVLVSAVWKEDSKLRRIWQIPGVELVTSQYVLVECERNLPRPEQLERLKDLLTSVRVLSIQPVLAMEGLPDLPAKDQPVLAAAVLSRSAFLITGDRTHFGALYGSTILGVRVESPGSLPSVLGAGFEMLGVCRA
jgi:predicted nucleic acid-binding protein